MLHLHYRNVRPLASGRHGVVWYGVVAETGKPRAIKVLLKNRQDMPRAQTRTLLRAEIDHLQDMQGDPHVVRLHRVLEDDDVACLEMEVCDDVAPLLACGSLPARHTLLHAARALRACHAKSIVHADVKPGNLLWSPTDRVVKLADFGSSARLTDPVSAPAGTGLVRWVTLSYTSPETLRDRGVVTPASDMWSLGVVALEMAAAGRKYGSVTLAHEGGARSGEEVGRTRGARDGVDTDVLSRVAAACLRRDPLERWTADDAVRELEDAAAEEARDILASAELASAAALAPTEPDA